MRVTLEPVAVKYNTVRLRGRCLYPVHPTRPCDLRNTPYHTLGRGNRAGHHASMLENSAARMNSVTDMRQSLDRIRRELTGTPGEPKAEDDADLHEHRLPGDSRGPLKAFHSRLVADMHRFVGASPALGHAVMDEALAEQEGAIRVRLRSLRERLAQPSKLPSPVRLCGDVSFVPQHCAVPE